MERGAAAFTLEQIHLVLLALPAHGLTSLRDIDSNSTTMPHRKLPGRSNRLIALHDPGHIGTKAGFLVHAPADEAMAGVGAVRAPLKVAGEDRGRLPGDGGQAFGLVKLHHAVLFIPHSHGDKIGRASCRERV